MPEVSATTTTAPTTPTTETSTELDVTFHAARCKVCRNNKIRAIENDYLDWRPLDEISKSYDVPVRSIQRHASFTGLKRKKMLDVQGYWYATMERSLNAKPKRSDGVESSKQLAKSLRILDADTNVTVPVQVNNFSNLADEQLQAYIDAGLRKLNKGRTD